MPRIEIPCDDCQGPLGNHSYAGVPIGNGRKAVLCSPCHAKRFPATALVAGPIADQPPPVPNERPAVWDLVIADMRERDVVGRARYGTPLQPHNGRDALVDAYQEALDLAVYLRQAVYERDGR